MSGFRSTLGACSVTTLGLSSSTLSTAIITKFRYQLAIQSHYILGPLDLVHNGAESIPHFRTFFCWLIEIVVSFGKILKSQSIKQKGSEAGLYIVHVQVSIKFDPIDCNLREAVRFSIHPPYNGGLLTVGDSGTSIDPTVMTLASVGSSSFVPTSASNCLSLEATTGGRERIGCSTTSLIRTSFSCSTASVNKVYE